jgi:hypothetical protein
VKAQVIENMFSKIRENFPNLEIKLSTTQIQEALRTHSRQDQKRSTSRNIIVS